MTPGTDIPGSSVEDAQRLSGVQDVLKLGSNENVLGPSPLAQAAIQQATGDLGLYPSPSQELALLRKLAGRLGHGLTEQHLAVSNGSSDMLRLLVQAFIGPGNHTIIHTPTFGVYSMLMRRSPGEVVAVPMPADYSLDLRLLLPAIDAATRLIIVCNPNNPTGAIVKHDAVRDFLAEVPPEVFVVFDEAYMEFADDPDFPRSLEFVQAGRRNVVVLRTFSKLYGLAGLRIGYAIAQPDVIDRVKQHKLVFHTGQLGLIGAAAALDDDEHAAKTIEMVRAGRRFLTEQLTALGFRCLPSQGNYLFLAGVAEAKTLCEQAMRRGVILRHTFNFGIDDGIRITIGRPRDNQRVIDTIKDILAAG